MLKYFSLKRLIHYCFLSMSHLPMRGHHRWLFLKLGGVKFAHKKVQCFVYKGVSIDTVAPELVTIGNGVTLTEGTKILTHFIISSKPGRNFRMGKVVIEDDVFIGMNTIICNSVTIDKGALIGAGSIVTKDIPPYQVWAGNPAKFVKERAR